MHALGLHLSRVHFRRALATGRWAHACRDDTIRCQEEAKMPDVGVSVDRRSFLHLASVYGNDKTQSLVCFICGQVKPGWTVGEPEIQYRNGAWVQRLRMEARDLNMGLSTFLSRYAEGRERGEGPFARAPEFEADNWEWKREFVLQKGQLRFTALCCPEDVDRVLLNGVLAQRGPGGQTTPVFWGTAFFLKH